MLRILTILLVASSAFSLDYYTETRKVGRFTCKYKFGYNTKTIVKGKSSVSCTPQKNSKPVTQIFEIAKAGKTLTVKHTIRKGKEKFTSYKLKTITTTPTPVPTTTPTSVPTTTTTPVPTTTPTSFPTTTPTSVPTTTPTPVPTTTPTSVPTTTPTPVTTTTPTPVSTTTPTPAPTTTPTPAPTTTPTPVPTTKPTPVPTTTSSNVSTISPTPIPTLTSTSVPTSNSTDFPSTATTSAHTNSEKFACRCSLAEEVIALIQSLLGQHASGRSINKEDNDLSEILSELTQSGAVSRNMEQPVQSVNLQSIIETQMTDVATVRNTTDLLGDINLDCACLPQ